MPPCSRYSAPLASVNMGRLDQYVAETLFSVSRSFAAKLIEQGKVTVNGQVQTKAGFALKPTDAVKIDFEPSDRPPAIDVPVLYEDNDCMVINKPIGLLTHSKGDYNPEATVASWLSSRVKGLGGERAGIVHRLDRLTSGVMVAAKTPEALSWLQKQFAQRKAKKTYIAVIKGELDNPEAIINMPIERNPRRPQTFRAGPQGKPAVTAYRVLQMGNGYSLLELKPTTGRTHQLRVHLAQLGHPIVGDELYGGAKADRLYLHALELEITLPSKERKLFTAPLPGTFTELVS